MNSKVKVYTCVKEPLVRSPDNPLWVHQALQKATRMWQPIYLEQLSTKGVGNLWVVLEIRNKSYELVLYTNRLQAGRFCAQWLR